MSHRALLRYCGNQTEGTVRNTYISKWREIHIQKLQMGGRRKWRLGGRLSMAARGDMGGCKFMKLGLGLPDTWSNPIKHHFWRFEHKFCRWSASKWNYHGIDTLEPQPTSKSGLGNLAKIDPDSASATAVSAGCEIFRIYIYKKKLNSTHSSASRQDRMVL